MTALLLWTVWFGGFQFENATVYDPAGPHLKSGIHFVVDAGGRLTLIAEKPIAPDPSRQTVKDALVLPPLSDFYSLLQERGLGFDQDLDSARQLQLIKYYNNIGMGLVRDPVFPATGLYAESEKGVDILAQNGYLEVRDGPAAGFGLIIDPAISLAEQVAKFPERGPITFWWTSLGGEVPVLWPRHATLVREITALARAKGQKVGCYVQDARPSEVGDALNFKFDFYAGVPAEMTAADSDWFGNAVWLPFASLNARRYCAENLDERLAALVGLDLYQDQIIADTREQLYVLRNKLTNRCNVWRQRQPEFDAAIAHRIQRDLPIGIGSSGGHMFCLSGDIRSELDYLKRLGASDTQLLRAAFHTTPELLGDATPFLQPSQKAHFIVYPNAGGWRDQIGGPVLLSFDHGIKIIDRLSPE